MKYFIKFITIIGCLQVWSCTVSVNYYFRNLTPNPVHLILVAAEEPMLGKFSFAYSQDVSNRPKFASYKEFDKVLPAKSLGNLVTCEIPARSTIYVGPGSNFNPFFSKAIVDYDNKVDTIYFNDLHKLKTKRALFSYGAWIDYFGGSKK